MSALEKKAVVRRLFEEVWNQHKMEVAQEIIHDGYSSAEKITFAARRGLQVLAAEMNFYREMYADLNFKIERMFTEEETVVSIWPSSGIANHETFIDRDGDEQHKSL